MTAKCQVLEIMGRYCSNRMDIFRGVFYNMMRVVVSTVLYQVIINRADFKRYYNNEAERTW